jgi:hypothetical protein
LTKITRPSNQNASATPKQPLFDDTSNLHYFENCVQYLLSFIVTQVVISHGTVTIKDDDKGDIFEDDEKEDEGYLFAGQDICTKY